MINLCGLIMADQPPSPEVLIPVNLYPTQQLDASLADVVQVTVFVRDMTELASIHQVRLRYFSEPLPTSTLVAVSGFVHPEALIEINALAALRASHDGI